MVTELYYESKTKMPDGSTNFNIHGGGTISVEKDYITPKRHNVAVALPCGRSLAFSCLKREVTGDEGRKTYAFKTVDGYHIIHLMKWIE